MREVEESRVVNLLAREVGDDRLDRRVGACVCEVLRRRESTEPSGAPLAGGIVGGQSPPARGGNTTVTDDRRDRSEPANEPEPVRPGDSRVTQPQGIGPSSDLDLATSGRGIELHHALAVGRLQGEVLEVGVSGLDAEPVPPGLERVARDVLRRLSGAGGLEVEHDDLVLESRQGRRLREFPLGEEWPRRQRQGRERLLVLAPGLQPERAQSSDAHHGQPSVTPV